MSYNNKFQIDKFKLTAIAAALISSTTIAAPDTSPTTDNQKAKLEVISITATKRPQSLNETSLAVTALSGSDLKNMRVTSPVELANHIPNVDIGSALGGTNPVVTVRGVGSNDFNSNSNPSVGIYVDEIFLSSAGMIDFLLFDVERAEVLKGPQGTLFGRNTNGGAISFSTVAPEFSESGFFNLGYGNYDTTEFEGAYGNQINDSWAYRFSGKYLRQGESHYTIDETGDDWGSREDIAGRFQLRYEPEDSVFKANLSVTAGSRDGSASPMKARGIHNADGSSCDETQPACFDNSLFVLQSFGLGDLAVAIPNNGDPYRVPKGDIDHINVLDVDSTSATVKMDWSLENVTITSVTGFINFERQFGDLADGSSASVLDIIHDEEINQWSQELRAMGEIEGLGNWVVGASYAKDDVKLNNIAESFNWALGQLKWDVDQQTEAWALFTHTEWQLNDDFKLIAGLRYSDEQRDFDYQLGAEFLNNQGGLDPILPLICGGGHSSFVEDFSLFILDDPSQCQTQNISTEQLSGRLGLDYQVNDQTLAYASYATGFKAGGFYGDIILDPADFSQVEPEELTAYEAGTKMTLDQGSAQWNTSIFLYDYQEIQTQLPSAFGTRLANAAQADVVGIESELTWAVTNNLLVQAGIGLLDTKINSDDPTLDGNKLPNSAKVQVTGMLRYEHPLASGDLLVAQGDFKYNDSTWSTAANQPVEFNDAYHLINGRLAYVNQDSGWEVALWVKNLTDEVYTSKNFDLTSASSLGNVLSIYGAPRTFGVSFNYDFD